MVTGCAEVERWGLSNVKFELQDVAVLEAPEQFVFITAMGAIHDRAKPRTVLT